MGMLSRLFGKPRADVVDAGRIYQALMTQSRQTDFFGTGRMPDSYEGRIDILTLHMSHIIYALRTHGENGRRLSQAVFDVMVDDFDSAFRSEGLTDSGVKRRIKPIMKLFYSRLKAFTDGFEMGDIRSALRAGPIGNEAPQFTMRLSSYSKDMTRQISDLTLGEIALADFHFPELTP